MLYRKPSRLLLGCILAVMAALAQVSPAAAQVASDQTYATTPDGVRIAIQEWGTPSGPELLLVHGLLGSHLSWIRQLQDPLLHRFRIITYDLRGHGLSGAPTDPKAYQNGRLWADELETVIEAKHLKRPGIAGWSMGALVLTDYLFAYGDYNLGGIVYVDGVMELKPEYIVAKPDIDRLLSSSDLKDYSEGVVAFIKRCFFQAPDATDLERFITLGGMASPVMTLAVSHGISNARAGPLKATVPALIIYGEHDEHLRRAMAIREKEVLPQAQLSYYPDAGHSPFFESSARFDSELASFVDRAVQPATSGSSK